MGKQAEEYGQGRRWVNSKLIVRKLNNRIGLVFSAVLIYSQKNKMIGTVSQKGSPYPRKFIKQQKYFLFIQLG